MIRTVKDLKDALAKVPDDKEIVVSMDTIHKGGHTWGPTGEITFVKEWEEGVTISCKQVQP